MNLPTMKDEELIRDQCLKLEDMYLGAKTNKIIQSAPKNDKTVNEFLQCAREAYVSCGSYLQKKLLLQFPLLRALSCIDPKIRGTTVCCKELKKLNHLLPCRMTESEEELFQQVHKCQVDQTLPDHTEGQRLDNWWAAVSEKGRYPTLSKVATGAMSIFHGPHVESSFNIMGDIMDDTSSRMNIETYSSIQTVKYSLRAKEQTSVEYFACKDILHDRINPKLIRNMGGAARERKRRLGENRKVVEEKCKTLNLPSTAPQSKAQETSNRKQEEWKARQEHIKKQQNRTKVSCWN